ncbi:MAG: phosphoglycerate mutase family protein [Flavobacteriaceae bacterium]
MLKSVVVCVSLSLFISCKKHSEKEVVSEEITTTYYLIRHAEKDRSDTTQIDPALTERGLERAKLWASYFDSIPLNEIYSTNFKRTQQTAMYVASKKKLPAEGYDPNSLISEDFYLITKGHKVLIVGHSNTTPRLANQLLGDDTYDEMLDTDNSSLYVVSLKGAEKKSEIRKVEL